MSFPFVHGVWLAFGYLRGSGRPIHKPRGGLSNRIGLRLTFYDVSFVVANTPEAKGKVERIHQVWQDRLPSYFALNKEKPQKGKLPIVLFSNRPR